MSVILDITRTIVETGQLWYVIFGIDALTGLVLAVAVLANNLKGLIETSLDAYVKYLVVKKAISSKSTTPK